MGVILSTNGLCVLRACFSSERISLYLFGLFVCFALALSVSVFLSLFLGRLLRMAS